MTAFPVARAVLAGCCALGLLGAVLWFLVVGNAPPGDATRTSIIDAEPIMWGKRVEYWVRQLRSGQPEARAEAKAALHQIGVFHGAAAHELSKSLSDRDLMFRVRAPEVLAEMEGGEQAIPVLTKLLDDPDEAVRAAASEALTTFRNELR